MNEELFGERRRALEEEFFARTNSELLGAMRRERAAERMKAEMGSVTGIEDEEVLDHLIGMGLAPETLMAVALVPLVAVAWADGRLQAAERSQVLRHAEALRIGVKAHALLTNWLEAPPGPALFETWTEYTKAVAPRLSVAARDQLMVTTSARAKDVAIAAAGEPFGFGRPVSRAEQHILEQIQAAFEVTATDGP